MKEDTRQYFKGVAETIRTAIGLPDNRHTAAIVVAGGSGLRFGTDTPKQFQMLSGMPVAVHALRAFEQSVYIDCVVCVCRKGDEDIFEDYKEKFALTKIRKIVVGGDTRQESVLHGIEALNDASFKKITHVAIHDAARPLITPEAIDNCVIAAHRFGASTAAHRATDTIKIAAKHDFIESTPDRETVWHATTPQVFELNLYRAAAYSALEQGFKCTDDNSLVENIDRPVKLVDVGPYNIKITCPEDLAVAEALLAYRIELSNSSLKRNNSESDGFDDDDIPTDSSMEDETK